MRSGNLPEPTTIFGIPGVRRSLIAAAERAFVCVGLGRLATHVALGSGLPSSPGTSECPGDEGRHSSGDEGVHNSIPTCDAARRADDRERALWCPTSQPYDSDGQFTASGAGIEPLRMNRRPIRVVYVAHGRGALFDAHDDPNV